MKTLKITFAALILTAIFSVNAFAQGNQQDATATASAEVMVPLVLNKITDIDFGLVARGDTPNLNPVTGDLTGGAGLSESNTSIAKFTLTGQEGANILVGWEKEDLEGPGDNIVFTPAVSFGDTDGDFGGATITDGSTQEVAVGTNYFWVGGSIAVDANQTAGEYEGSFKLIVEYN